ncbi:MAG: epoxyqueuosine reductase QueH, partial [Clostridia bacterium]
MKKLLIHTCCAPCFTYIHDDITIHKILFKEDVDVTALWYNPNIHPKFEYERRKNTLISYCNSVNCKLDIIDEYDIKSFLKNTINLDNRCSFCYYTRLNKLFSYAKENNFDMVMTTLSISPYQNQELLQKIG